MYERAARKLMLAGFACRRAGVSLGPVLAAAKHEVEGPPTSTKRQQPPSRCLINAMLKWLRCTLAQDQEGTVVSLLLHGTPTAPIVKPLVEDTDPLRGHVARTLAADNGEAVHG